MPSVDQRIVQASFENDKFEQGIKQSRESLKALQKDMALKDSTTGMSALTKAAEAVSHRFSTMGIIGDQVLRNITNSAMRAGSQLTRALTITPLKMGFNEYELKMTAVQTLIAGTGEPLDRVNKKLNELNAYSDRTIYSFSDMTSNIGKFTNAGVSLDDSVDAMKGIANWAALSGASASDASRAMYNLGQALGTGKVTVRDWMSIENANMATMEFKETVIGLAKEMGTIEAGTEVTGENFRAMLEKGFFTNDVLMRALNMYGDDTNALGKKASAAATEVKTFSMLIDTLKEGLQSGWAQTWEIIVGDFEEAKALFTGISNAVGKLLGDSSDARNKLLADWKMLGGREAIIKAFVNIYNILGRIGTEISNAWGQIFAPIDASILVKASQAFVVATTKILRWLTQFNGESTRLQQIGKIFQGFFAVLSMGKEIVSQAWKSFKEFLSGLGFGAGVDKSLQFLADLGDKLTALNTSLKEYFAGGPIDAKGFGEKIRSILFPIKEVADSGGTVDDASKTAEGAGDFLTNFGAKVKGFVEKVGGLNLGTLIIGFLGIASMFKVYRAVTSIGKIGKTLNKGIGSIISSITDVIGSKSQVGPGVTEGIKNIAISLAALAAALQMISGIETGKLLLSVIVLGGIIAWMVVLTKAISKMRLRDGAKLLAIAPALIALGVAVNLFAASLLIIASLSVGGLIKGIIGLGAVLGALIGFMALMKRLDLKMGMLNAISLVILGVALNTFAMSIKQLGELSTESLIKGVVGLGLVLLEIVGFMHLVGKAKIGIRQSIALVIIANAMNSFAAALSSIGQLSVESIIKGLVGMGGIMIELTLFLKATQALRPNWETIANISIVAESMRRMAEVLAFLGALDLPTMARGLLGLGALMGGVVVFLHLIKSVPRIGIGDGVGLVLLAASISILASTLKSLAELEIGSMLKGIFGLSAVMLALALFMRATKAIKFGPGTGFALILLGTSLLLFTQSLKTIGDMTFGGIVKGLFGLAAVLVILGVFLKSLQKIKVGLGGIGVIIALIPLGIAINLFAIALQQISMLSTGGIIKGLIGMGAIMLELAGFLILTKAIPVTSVMKALVLVGAMALAMIAFAATIKLLEGVDAGSAVGFYGSLAAFLLGGTAGLLIINTIPFGPILIGIGKLMLVFTAITAAMALVGVLSDALNLKSGIDSFGKLMFSIGEALGSIVGGLMAGMAKGLPKVGEALTGFMDGADGFFKGIKNLNPSSLEGVSTLVNLITSIGKANVMNAISNFITGGNAMDKFSEDIDSLGAGVAAYAKHVSGFDSVSKTDVKSATEAAQGISNLANTLPRSGGWVQSIIGARDLGKFAGDIPDLGDALKNYAESVGGFTKTDATGFDIAAKAAQGLSDLANSLPATDGLLQLIIGTKGLGPISADIPALGDALAAYADSIATPFSGKTVPNSVQNAQDAALGIATLASSLPPTGGLAQIITGTQELNSVIPYIPDLGAALASYMTNIFDPFSGKTVPKVVESANNAITGLTSLVQSVPPTGGLAQYLVGVQDLGKFTTHIGPLGDALAEYGEAVKTFKTVPKSAAESAKEAAIGLAALVEAVPKSGGLMEGLTGFRDMTGFVGFIRPLGEALEEYATYIGSYKKVTPESSQSARDAAIGLAALIEAVPYTGGAQQLGTGFKDLRDFSKNLPALGEALVEYSTFISAFDNIPAQSSNAAVGVVSSLADLIGAIPSVGGMSQAFNGMKNISMFGDDLPDLGSALKEYAASITGFTDVDDSDISKATKAGKGLAQVLTAMPNTGAITDFFTGSKNLDSLSSKLKAFGGGLKEYATAISGFATTVSEDDVGRASATAAGIQSFATTLDDTGGWTQKITGQKDLGKFGENLKTLGAGFKEYSTSIKGFSSDVSEDDIGRASSAATSIQTFSASLGKTGGWIQAIAGQTDIGAFGTNAGIVGKGLKEFATAISGDDVISSKNAIAVMESIKEFQEDLDPEGSLFQGLETLFVGDKSITRVSGQMVVFGNDFQAFGTAISMAKDVLQNFAYIKYVITSFSAVSKQVKDGTINTDDMIDVALWLGVSFATAIGDGIEGQNGTIIPRVTTFAQALLTAMGPITSKFYTLGQNIGLGLQRGIENATAGAVRAASELARRAFEASQKKLDVGSPSKEYIWLGEMSGQGYVKGVENETKNAENAAKKLVLPPNALLWAGVTVSDAPIGNKNIFSGVADAAKDTKDGLTKFTNDAKESINKFNPSTWEDLDYEDLLSGWGNTDTKEDTTVPVKSGGKGGKKAITTAPVWQRVNTMQTVGKARTQIDQMNLLADRVAALGNSINGMKVVMDSGALVGQIQAPIDRQLGMNALYSGRR